MKKMTMVAVAAALALPMMATAADIDASGHHYSATAGTVAVKSSGLCYGIKFKGNGKADPLTLPTGIDMRFISDQPTGTFVWVDPLLHATYAPLTNELMGDVISRKKNTVTLGFNDPAAQKTAATALLSYAGQNGQFFNVLLANATVTSYVVTVSLKNDSAKIVEKAVVASTEGACTASASVTRTWSKALHVTP